jgi:hypothetical protein
MPWKGIGFKLQLVRVIAQACTVCRHEGAD